MQILDVDDQAISALIAGVHVGQFGRQRQRFSRISHLHRHGRRVTAGGECPGQRGQEKAQGYEQG